jgi:hypothetical protein
MVGGAQAATRDSTLNARVLVFVKEKSKPHRERNGASLKPKASTPSFTLDTAVVVIDRMTAFESQVVKAFVSVNWWVQVIDVILRGAIAASVRFSLPLTSS